MKVIQRIGKTAGAVGGAIAAASLISLFVLLILQIVFRFVLNVSASWIEEAARICYITMVLFGSSWCIANNEHITVDFLVKKLPPRLFRLAKIIFCLLIAYFLYGVFRGGLRMIEIQGEVYVPGIPFLRIRDMYLIIPTSIALMWLGLLGEIARNVSFLFGDGTDDKDASQDSIEEATS